MSDLTWAEWRDRRESTAQKRRSELDYAVLYFLANASEPMTERAIGAALEMDLTTVHVVTRRLQKCGELRCEPRQFQPIGQGKSGRFAWAISEPPMQPPCPINAELNARIAARVAALAETERRARAKGTKRCNSKLGPFQTRALAALKAKPLTAMAVARAIGQTDYTSLATTLGGLVHLGLIESQGDAWRAR